MSNQKSLSLRLDYDAVAALDIECRLTNCSRNRLINRSCKMFRPFMQLQRDYKKGEVTEKQFNQECHRLLTLFSTPII